MTVYLFREDEYDRWYGDEIFSSFKKAEKYVLGIANNDPVEITKLKDGDVIEYKIIRMADQPEKSYVSNFSIEKVKVK